jgi:predicted metal-binding protein
MDTNDLLQQLRLESAQLQSLLDQVKQTRVFQCGLAKPAEIKYRQEIREICKDNSCGQYGKTWACPPAVGTVEECKDRCLQYSAMLVFTGKFMLEDSFDFEGMARAMNDFKRIAHDVESAAKSYLKTYLVLSNESCNTCKTCAYPDAPCRFPEQLHHSIEGYGILVSELAKQAGVNYNNGNNTVTYFGALLFNDTEN